MKKDRVLVTGGSGFIGVHVIDFMIKLGYEILNLDIKSPINDTHLDKWKNVSITNSVVFRSIVLDFDPNYVIHLAAITIQNANSLEEFGVNIQGTKNVIDVSNDLKNLKKLIFTSTQYVNTPGLPIHEHSPKLIPYGFYGVSKLIGEELIRKDFLTPNWIIIRPTTIWGPWHRILANGLWKQIMNRRYFHPNGDSSIKAYGYVKNTAWQIAKLLEKENFLTDKQVFYLADHNLSQKKWVKEFVIRLTGRQIREIPKILLFIASEVGELLVRMGLKFPLYRSRYRNLMTSNPSPLEKTLELLGPSPISLIDAIDETCAWLEETVSANKWDKIENL